MGFSTSGAALILFLGMLVSASIFAPSVERAVEEITDAEESRNERVLERRNTAVELQTITYDASAETVTANATNVGATTLSVAGTDLLLNGSIRSYDASIGGITDPTVWAPGETLTAEVTGVPASPARVALVTEHGVKLVSTNVTEVP